MHGASMRPGRVRPGNRPASRHVDHMGEVGFNEAGAGPPRKYVISGAQTGLSMRPGRVRPGNTTAGMIGSAAEDRH